MEIEGEAKRITSEESYDSSNHSLLIIDTSSFVVFLRKASSEGSKGSSWNDDFLDFWGLLMVFLYSLNSSINSEIGVSSFFGGSGFGTTEVADGLGKSFG